ncbi:nitrogen permease regulator 3 [Scheffersomyces coipomensis]|uniref:nitrogen permease regulator 3 n=1 Tax=Scheffersomyces coipomensis TaxID=1788519 RepID=UPI00315D477C
MSFNLPNPSLLGILLVISTHSGPQLIFKYPDDLSSNQIGEKINSTSMTSNNDLDNSSDEELVDFDDYEIQLEQLKQDSDKSNELSSHSHLQDLQHQDSQPNLQPDNSALYYEDPNVSNLDSQYKSGNYLYYQWDYTDNLNFHMDNTKDIISFLSELELKRDQKFKLQQQQQQPVTTSNPLLSSPTLSGKKKLKQLQKTQSLTKTNSNVPSIPSTTSNSIPGLSSSITNLLHSNPNAQTTSTTNTNTDLIFGIEPSYLCEMLAPPKKMCNTRFETAINNKVFLGLPIHKYDNGNWRLKNNSNSKRHHKSHKKKHSKKDSTKDEKDTGDGKVKHISSFINNDYVNEYNVDDNNGNDNNNENDEDEDEQPKSKLNMNMFHLVFIMNPPVIERNYRIDEMFHFVISKLTLILRYEQSKSDFISNEIKSILTIKEQHSKDFSNNEGLMTSLLNKSSLCKIIQDCYLSISQSKIANLLINNKLRSFQIPIKTEFHSLPESSVPFIPGSHLSSIVNLLSNTGLISIGETTRYGSQYNNNNGSNINYNSNPQHFQPQHQQQLQQQRSRDDEEEGNDPSDDIIYFALLLLDDPESIIRDIKTESESSLANFIRTINPTESLIKLSLRNNNSLDIVQIKSFAFHLIYWRRARVIQPLSTRSVYIVSPMAPITINLFDDIIKFKKAFPTLPSLPHFLKLLSPQSKKPSQFATIIPSKDHRDIYLEALSWLIRYGYVTQLQTFIWLKISRKIKIKVEEDLENENLNRKRSSLSSNSKSKSKNPIGGTDNTSKTTDKNDKNDTTDNKLIDKDRKLGDGDNNNTKSDEDKEIENIKQRLQSNSIGGPRVTLEDEDDTIILDPGRATALERRWINKIVYEESKLSPELIKIFYKLLKYMNGKSPLELLLLKENISRGDLRKLLFAIEDHIISVRHW